MEGGHIVGYSFLRIHKCCYKYNIYILLIILNKLLTVYQKRLFYHLDHISLRMRLIVI